jgi:hypothetical protein
MLLSGIEVKMLLSGIEVKMYSGYVNSKSEFQKLRCWQVIVTFVIQDNMTYC